MKKFECPLSPHIMWYAGLSYMECPLVATERDMGACQNCHLRGEVPSGKKQSRDKEPEVKQKRKKEEIPKINKTYVGK